MRAIIQRVARASVTVDENVVSSIGEGVCVLLGICREDTAKDAEYISRKIINLRLFDDESGKRWAKSVKDKNLEILCVSQFTLHAFLKGNKPDFHKSMDGQLSKPLFDTTLQMMEKAFRKDKVKTGVFGAMMKVEIVNDGPVTITIDSHQAGNSPDSKAESEKITSQECGEEIKPTKDAVSHSVEEKDLKPALTPLSADEEETAARAHSRISSWQSRLQSCADILGTSCSSSFSSPLESVVASLKMMVKDHALLGRDPEEKALIDHWLQRGVDTFEETVEETRSANKESRLTANKEARLKEIDAYLTSRVFFVGNSLSIADIFYYVCLHNQVSAMTFHEKEKYLNLTRWFSCLQSQFREFLSDVVFTRSILY